MEFGALLGNDALKQRLSAALAKGQLSHCYLISGPEGAGKRTLATLLAAAMQCTGTKKPCCRCPQCRKALDGMHPDIVTVDDPEKKGVSVKLVREACADLYVRPNEGAKKIYIFPRAQELNPQGQNALLKCIEEPPAYGVFFLLTDNASRLLPTIRSRCVELRMAPLSEAQLLSELQKRLPDADAQTLRGAVLRSGGYLGQALTLAQENASLLPQTEAFAAAYAKGSSGGLLRVLAPMEKLKREQLRPILLQWYALLTSALTAQNGQPSLRKEASELAASRSATDLLHAVDALDQAQKLLDANVGTAHICGALFVKLNQPS
ncbi:MAG: ATP-binding protein [Faecousia sp.]|nr:DNA polymerase III subunit [Bacillota bacterium]